VDLRNKDPRAIERWDEYLSYLAFTIDNLHMIITCDVILGGKIAKYLTQEDLKQLRNKIHKRTAFPSREPYIKISKSTNLPLCVGAAIPLVNKYLETLY